ncbi:MAG: hypothetical protein HY554_00955 [Elusimicrobia bacterium]|nr:hypothetical protein [Elusimicrobiota bacterium]
MSARAPEAALALRYARALLLAALGLYALAGLRVLGDYGPNPDSGKNWDEGRANLDFLATGEVDARVVRRQTHGALFMMAAELSRRTLEERLGLLDAVAARHVILIPLNLAFALALFRFVRLRSDPWTGLVAALGVLTYPKYFGFSFNNLKDVPLVIFFSLAMMAWADRSAARGLGSRLSFFGFWGLALCSKLYALLVPLLLLVWTASRGGGDAAAEHPKGRRWAELAAGLALTGALVAALYAPAWWALPDKAQAGTDWLREVSAIALRPERGWSAWSFRHLVLRAPAAWLACAAVGLACVVRDYRRDPLSIAAPWLLVPLILPCLPGLYGYADSFRLLLIHCVPLSILAARGGGVVAGALATRLPAARALVGLLLLLPNLRAIVSTHPYQTTFFNALAGGLGGAQAAGLASSGDTWLSSHREVGRWLDANAAKDAEVWEVDQFPWQRGLLRRFGVRRPDVRVVHYDARSAAESPIEANTYVVVVAYRRDLAPVTRRLEKLTASGELRRALEIKRQGGKIATVYHRR